MRIRKLECSEKGENPQRKIERNWGTHFSWVASWSHVVMRSMPAIFVRVSIGFRCEIMLTQNRLKNPSSSLCWPHRRNENETSLWRTLPYYTQSDSPMTDHADSVNQYREFLSSFSSSFYAMFLERLAIYCVYWAWTTLSASFWEMNDERATNEK